MTFFMKSSFSFLFAAILLGACANETFVKPRKDIVTRDRGPLLKDGKSSYPVGRAVRLEFAAKNLSAGQSYRVNGYMKCCKTPVEIKFKMIGESLVADIAELWSPGIYVINVAVVDDDQEIEISKQSVEIEAN